MSNSNSSSNKTASPQHPATSPTAAAASSLQVPGVQRSGGQSSSSWHRSFHQSRSGASTPQSHVSSSTRSDWTSASAVSQSSAAPSLKPYFYPTSGYPISSSILQHSYPSSGYPVSHLHHSYGYPANNFPCCEVPGVTDLGSRLMYPSSEFPGGGVFPGEIDQDDGSAPFISGLPSVPSAPFGGGNPTGFPGDHISPLPTSDSVYTPGSYDSSYYNPGYPI